MRVFTVTQGLSFYIIQGKGCWITSLFFIEAVKIIGNNPVITPRSPECLNSEFKAHLLGNIIAVGLQFLNNKLVTFGVYDDNNMFVIFGSRPNHRRTAD